MERKSGLWMATTAKAAWQSGGTLGSTRKGEANLLLDRRRDQVWDGFGGCFNELGWIALGALKGGDRNRILDALFDPEEGCRFNIARLPIGASDYAAEWYSHNEVDGDLGMKHFSIARDRRYQGKRILKASEEGGEVVMVPGGHESSASDGELRLGFV